MDIRSDPVHITKRTKAREDRRRNPLSDNYYHCLTPSRIDGEEATCPLNTTTAELLKRKSTPPSHSSQLTYASVEQGPTGPSSPMRSSPKHKLPPKYKPPKTSHQTGNPLNPKTPNSSPTCLSSNNKNNYPDTPPTTSTNSKMPSEWSEHGINPTQRTRPWQTKSKVGPRPAIYSLRTCTSMNSSTGECQPSSPGIILTPTYVYSNISSSNIELVSPANTLSWINKKKLQKECSKLGKESAICQSQNAYTTKM
jgi:hypothetical protein